MLKRRTGLKQGMDMHVAPESREQTLAAAREAIVRRAERAWQEWMDQAAVIAASPVGDREARNLRAAREDRYHAAMADLDAFDRASSFAGRAREKTAGPSEKTGNTLLDALPPDEPVVLSILEGPDNVYKKGLYIKVVTLSRKKPFCAGADVIFYRNSEPFLGRAPGVLRLSHPWFQFHALAQVWVGEWFFIELPPPHDAEPRMDFNTLFSVAAPAQTKEGEPR